MLRESMLSIVLMACGPSNEDLPQSEGQAQQADQAVVTEITDGATTLVGRVIEETLVTYANKSEYCFIIETDQGQFVVSARRKPEAMATYLHPGDCVVVKDATPIVITNRVHYEYAPWLYEAYPYDLEVSESACNELNSGLDPK